jgi:hypothetical protein
LKNYSKLEEKSSSIEEDRSLIKRRDADDDEDGEGIK